VTVVCAVAVLSSYLVSKVLVLIDAVVWITVPIGTLAGMVTVIVLDPLPKGNAWTVPMFHVTLLVPGS
jgi:hypothetical protein